MSKMTEQIIQVIQAGGGVVIDAKSKMTEQLVEIASAAAQANVVVILKNSESKMTEHLVRIAQAGKGKVLFEI